MSEQTIKQTSPLEPSSFSRKSAAIIIIIYCIISLIPIVWMVMTSFKSANDAVSYPPLVYFDPSLEGWVNLFTQRSRQSQEYLESLPPPKHNAAVLLDPVPPGAYRASFKSATSVQDVPFHDSLRAEAGYPAKHTAEVLDPPNS